MNISIKELKKWTYLLVSFLLIGHLGFTCKKHYLSHEIPIFLFHSIGERTYKSDIWGISTDKFSTILDSLKKLGYRTLTLEELEKTVTEGIYPKSPPYCVLTFDDGCKSHLDTVVPELVKRSFSGVFFVPMPPTGSGPEPPESFLQPDKFNKLLIGGDVQSHSRTFETLTIKAGETRADYDKRIKYDIGDYRTELSKITNRSVYALAYPSGEFDQNVMASAKTFEYRLAFTTEYGTANNKTDPLLIPRYMITDSDSLDDILLYLEGNKKYEKAIMLFEALAIILTMALMMKKKSQA
jgi:peptidoglycan/xylan/chitin deacetylase (PgdA/CDA1 family)